MNFPWSKKDKIISTDLNGEQVITVINTESSKAYEYKSVTEMYNNCPYVRAIIDYKISCMASFNLKMYKYNKGGEDEEITSSPILNFLKKPNPFQTIQDLYAQSLLYEILYSKSFIRGVRGLYNGFEKSKALWSLPPEYVQILYKGFTPNVYNKFSIEEIIDKYQFTYITGTEEIFPEYILNNSTYKIDFNQNLDNYSQIETLRQSVANLMYIQESRGVLTRNRGALGMLSPSPTTKDTAGGGIMIDRDKDEVLKKYKSLYGLKPGQSSVIIPTIPMTWTSMTLNIADLRLDESALHEFNIICDLLGMPRGMFDDKTQYNNQTGIQKKFYQDSTIPYAENRAKALTEKYKLTDSYFVFDYSHIVCLQEDYKLKEDVEKTKTERILSLYEMNLISKGEVCKELGYVVTDQSWFNIYFKD